jgi:hypothetical protein
MSRNITLICEIDIEQSFDSFHAHAIPDGAEIGPGDVVIVHDAPQHIAYGERFTGECAGTLIRASWAGRLWTQLSSIFEITELYEVGFQPIETKG